ncbi:MAG TPA: SprT family zinc-dependent metalloprotease [Anaerolineales bacterium]|nr:SprT family zinc-dependent metalloprotease [Anaerolineales bacterium]
MNIRQIDVGGITVDVVFKDIKNVHLSVHPPTGRVRIAAPSHMKLETIRVYAIAKIDWIKKHQKKFREQERETRREYLDRESHYVWGRRYLLKVREENQTPSVELKHNQMILIIRPGAVMEKREAVVTAWYREQLKNAVTPLIAKWEPILGVKVDGYFVQKMKTKWGSCTPSRRTIRLNPELAKKPRECLEYVAVHEMVHLLEPSHNATFLSLMDNFMPQWRHFRDELNRAPLGHVEWEY